MDTLNISSGDGWRVENYPWNTGIAGDNGDGTGIRRTDLTVAFFAICFTVEDYGFVGGGNGDGCIFPYLLRPGAFPSQRLAIYTCIT